MDLASLAKTGETNLEKSAREYRKGPDLRTYPGWTGVFAGMKRRRGLTDAAIVAELRQTGYFDNPPLADEGAVSKTNGPPRGGGVEAAMASMVTRPRRRPRGASERHYFVSHFF